MKTMRSDGSQPRQRYSTLFALSSAFLSLTLNLLASFGNIDIIQCLFRDAFFGDIGHSACFDLKKYLHTVQYST